MKREEREATDKLEKWAAENHGSALWLAAGIMYRGGASAVKVLDYIRAQEKRQAK